MPEARQLSHSSVLVLNQNYEPLNVCNARRALVLVDKGKAEILEHAEGYLRAAVHAFHLPSVIRMVYMIKRPKPEPKLSRREVFARDRFTCQYCGRKVNDLTIDHVVPRRLGGKHLWTNVVSACKNCNHRKAGRTPEQAKMALMTVPAQPRINGYYMLYSYASSRYEWQKFIPEWEKEYFSAV